MLNIINDIIDISKIEAGLMGVTLSDTDLKELMDFIFEFFIPQAEAKNLRLILVNNETGPLTIKTDREKVYAILVNLVKNAIKHTERGTIEFGYEMTNSTNEGAIQFFIKDSGIGIPEDRREAIFERFVQADISDKMARQGAGLGLSISQAYVEMLGGKIWLTSEEGIGSTFFFTIPFNPNK